VVVLPTPPFWFATQKIFAMYAFISHTVNTIKTIYTIYMVITV